MVSRGAKQATTTKRWFIIQLLAHALRDPNFRDEFRIKLLTSNTIAHLLCTHYNITLQHLKINGKSLRTLARMKATEGI